jgi:hypothetical protein
MSPARRRPTQPSEPTSEPSTEPTSEPAEPTGSPELAVNPPTAGPPADSRSAAVSPAGTPTSGDVTWWLIAVPVIALLALAAAGTALLIQRTERRPY